MNNKLRIILIVGLLLLGACTMPDAPDGYEYRLSSHRHVLDDMAELAARLGSPNVYDRSGSVFWMTDMGTGIDAWRVGHSGGTSDIFIDTRGSMHGGYVLSLSAGTTGDKWAYVYRKLTPHIANKWGLETSVWFPSAFDNFMLELVRFDGTHAHNARFYLSDADDKIYYWEDKSMRVELADLPHLPDTYELSHCMKILADYENDEYIGFYLDDNYYPMTGIPLAVYEAPDYPMSYIQFRITGLGNQNDEALIDYVIMTTGEP